MLLDVPTYQTLSGDITTDALAVTTALADAQFMLEDYLNRSLEQMTRTELVRLHPDGRAYPLATPIISVSIPVGAVVMDNAVMGLIPQINPLWDFLFEPYRYSGVWDTTGPVSSITYVGGFTPALLPRKLRQAIVDLARVGLQQFDPVTANVKSASVDGTSVTYATAPDRAGVTASILKEVRGYRRRDIGH